MYAPAEREALTRVREKFQFLGDSELIDKIINALPSMGAILNEHRQVIYANQHLLSKLNLRTVEGLLGQRPGEILHCVNANREIGGCGTSKNCSVCGAVNSILECQERKEKVSKECRIHAIDDGKHVAYEFLVTTSPLSWQGENFYIMVLGDLSAEKRRRALEQIFFHDVLNKTGSMYGFIDLIKREQDPEKIKQFVGYLDMLNNDLNSEIQYQRALMDAEAGELTVNISSMSSADILNSSIRQISSHDVARGKDLVMDANSGDSMIDTDVVLLRRVLMNMIKNSLESTPVGGRVTVGVKEIEDSAEFWVHNESMIPEEVQLQIFQRSFSTKGRNRGLGTYSMKLLGENYLGGASGLFFR